MIGIGSYVYHGPNLYHVCARNFEIEKFALYLQMPGYLNGLNPDLKVLGIHT
jgi:hypothetical protein